MTALLDLPSLEAMARNLGEDLGPGEVVWLEGELGAGKTTFVQALAAGLRVSGQVTSPSYALVHHYDAPGGPVYHVDCYRLKRPDDARDLDWETLRAGAALLIEWPEKAGAWAPNPSRRIRLFHTPNPDVRRLEVG